MTDPRPHVEPGIYFGMPEAEYHAAAGLSVSGMKHLAISPLHYWHQHLNPRAVKPGETSAQRFGRAVHCALLEPARYPECYAQELSLDDYPGALVTTDDLKAFLAENQLPVSGKRKQDLIDRIAEHELDAVIWDVEKERHARLTVGKTLLDAGEFGQLRRIADVVQADPYAQQAFTGGHAEVSFFVRDPETGVLLKARVDYLKPKATVDLKTFSNSRGKPTDRAVFEAIYYEGYYLQAVAYRSIREFARLALRSGEIEAHDAPPGWRDAFVGQEGHGFAFVFVESAEPFDLRIVQLREAEVPGADINVYWMAALGRIAELSRLYADCFDRFGADPWREPSKPHVLEDADIPQLLFNGSGL